MSNLISRRLVLVEIVLSIESTGRLDITIQCGSGTQRGEKRRGLEFLLHQHLFSSISIGHLIDTNRLTPRKRQVKQSHIGIRKLTQHRWSTYRVNRCPLHSIPIRYSRENSLASVSNCAWISIPTVSSHCCRDSSSFFLVSLLRALADLASCLSCFRSGVRSSAATTVF